MKSISWPHVGLGAIAAATFCGIFYMSDTTMRLGLVGVVSGIGTAVTTYITAKRINGVQQSVNETRDEMTLIKEHVNGTTRQLVNKIPDADRPTEIPQL